VIDDCDTVLIMSVNPGFSGQSFIPRSLEKIRQARELIDRRGSAAILEVDGGVGRKTAREVVDAGADAIVMGSAVFDAPDPGAEVRYIRSLLE
jgi:ribulose-phosphate 3-epimerase